MPRRSSNVLPFRRRWTRPADYGARGRGAGPLMVMLPLAAFTAVFLWDGPSPGLAAPLDTPDSEAARFVRCTGPARTNCVVDGDTSWYRGEKIRLADINTPEVSSPGCPREAALGAAASERLLALLNQGSFTLEPADRDRDRYDRLLRVATRDGQSLGGTLVREGLAERWQGYRRDWC